MRRLLLLISLILAVFAAPVCADDEGSLLFDSFETAAGLSHWDGGIQTDETCTDGDCSLLVNNPYGEETDGKISHVLYSMDAIPLNAGEIYRISFDAMDPLSTTSGDVTANTRFGEGTDNIVFEFNGFGEGWTTASAFFMVPENADYGFSLELKNGDPYVGFFIDRLEISRVSVSPESLTISGPSELTIPVAGVRETRYGVEARTAEGEMISVLAGVSSLTAEDLPADVYFDELTGAVTVGEACPDGASFTLVCTPPDYLSLPQVSLRVTLTKNLLKNPAFDNDGEFWETDGGYDFGSGYFGSYMTLFTETSGPYGYYATLRPTEPLVLVEGVMYVFRALVRVDSGSDISAYSQNTALSLDGEVVINIINLSAGDWTEVFAAFTPEASGIYNLSLNFSTAEPGIISVGSPSLAPEPPDETFLTLHAPGNISLPDTATVYPLNAYIRDQAGEIMSGRCKLSLYPEGQGVELVDGGIAVFPDAIEGEYEIFAVSAGNQDLSASLFFTVSHDNVADGGFESYAAGSRWAAASPARLKIEENVDGRFARVTSDGDYAIVMNNSYMHLYEGVPYAFKAGILGGTNAEVTAFIETVDGERIPVVQSSSGEDIFELFQPDFEMIGRLLLYISSEYGGIDLWLDNVELFRSIVTASPPRVTGRAESGAELSVEFEFFNNMDPTNDASACAISWYGMSAGGEPVRVGGGLSFVVRADLVGRYVYAEVTPICAITGLSGFPVQSVPLAIGELRDDDYLPQRNDQKTENNAADEPDFSPVTLSEDGGALPFSDMMNHWAKEYVLPLYNSGVIKGRTEASFSPDGKITRAELAAILRRAFGARAGVRSFADVPADAWYSADVASLGSLGVINGTSESEFSPDVPVNREELTVMLIRLYERLCGEAEAGSTKWFYDSGEISDWAVSSVGKGVNLGLVTGTETSTFAPKRAATRAEACAMIFRLLDMAAR